MITTIYFIGVVLAFIVNTIHLYVFFKDIRNKPYSTYNKVLVAIYSSIIIGFLSWIGLFFVSVSLFYRLNNPQEYDSNIF